jgi:hypothetical protein
MTRPPLGDIKPGDPVIITDPDRPRSITNGHVVKVARVWITMASGTPENPGRSYRMKRDNQSENTGYGYGGCRFATPEQHAWDQQFSAASAFLRGHGIRFDFGSEWGQPYRQIQLAAILRSATEETTR